MRPEDAELAAAAGADAIGMIFHPSSRRNIPIDQARRIVAHVGPFVTPVGVFVNAPADHIVSMARTVGVSMVQLHGQETPRQVQELAGHGLRILKAIRVDESLEDQLHQWREAMPALAGSLIGLVLDAASVAHAGGSGESNDWDAIRRAQASGWFDDLPSLVAAGGLDPRNVGMVVQAVRPWAVDVSTGVESSLGIKSSDAVTGFIASVRHADAAVIPRAAS
jgi:phosphoribosylanthranilate isomerase